MKNSILIVDDNDEVRDTLAHLLRLRGLLVQEAFHGAHALELIASFGPPSIIILDIMMPVMNGPVFLKELRSYPQYSNVPVVLFSAVEDMVKVEGATDYLKKPGGVEDIFNILKKYRLMGK